MLVRPHLCVLVYIACALNRPLAAQTTAGQTMSIGGRVTSADGAPVAGASVVATPDDTGRARATLTDRQGEFSLVLAPARYTLTVTAHGFEPVSRVLDGAAPVAPLDVVLPVAGVAETVDVSAPAPGYTAALLSSATRTAARPVDVPQSVSVVTKDLIRDQLMTSVADVVRYVPGITAHQGENNRDQVVIRGNSSSAGFFLDGVRDDVQYYRDLYNVERIEALKGPNALMFGRGNGGGVINRVTKTAGFEPFRDVSVTAGSFGEGRLTLDVDQPLGARAAVRLNGVYERAGSFRDFGALERYGVNPTATLLVGPRTIVTLAYEHVRDRRVADRGIPSFRGFPADVSRSTYFGDPLNSFVRARVDSLSASIDHQSGPWTWRSRTLAGSYERGYQNFVPGAVTADRRFVSLSAYNNDTARVNAFNQTDVTYAFQTGELRHTLLSGVELGRQATVNFRNTGYFDGGTTSILVPRDRPTIDAPVSFRQSATDADNHMRAAIAAAYAQDQVELSRFVRVIAGLRVEAFDLAYHDNRTGADLARLDRLVSPRAGLVVKPRPAVSLYGSYTVSQLPGSGDQFASLTSVTEQLEPEAFTSYEAGAKWDVGPGLSLTAAAYRLDRTHTRSIDPNDATRIVQTGSQRTNGIEAGVAGRITSAWQMAGGYAWQDAFVTSATASAAAGARAAQVPRHTLSLWNLYQVNARIGAGIGIVGRTDMFAAIDDAVVLPGYTDVDAALYVALTPRLRLQANVENVFDRIYYVNADNNTNISPGAPRSLRIALSAHF